MKKLLLGIFLSLGGQPILAAHQTPNSWAVDTLKSMSVEQKAGQLIFGGMSTSYAPVGSEALERARREIQEYHLGGYHAFRGDVLSAAYLIHRLQEAAEIPLLITADLEGGAGLIFNGATRLPRAMALAATGDPDLVEAVGRLTASEAARVGVGINFFPVGDVNNNPDNPIINVRSFGEDPSRVAELTAAYVRGFQSGGLLATVKHFPGHGDTAVDSHMDLPVIQADSPRLEAIEWPPFIAAIREGAAAVMTAHLLVPSMDPDLPATLSPRILQNLLRDRMGFSGLIITDAMNMQAITRRFPVGEAAVRALEAGADIILLPESVGQAYQAVVRAVQEGRIQESRLDQSVLRVLQAKARIGLGQYKPSDFIELDREVGSGVNLEFAEQAMERALTLVRDDRAEIPLALSAESDLLVVPVFDQVLSGDTRGRALSSDIRKRFPRAVVAPITPDTTSSELALIQALARRVDAVLVGAFVRVADGKGSVSLPDRQIRFLKQLSVLPTPSAFITFGSPYLLSAIPEMPNNLLTFDDFPGAELAAVRAVLGEAGISGRLPVQIPGLYPIGHGLNRSPRGESRGEKRER